MTISAERASFKFFQLRISNLKEQQKWNQKITPQADVQISGRPESKIFTVAATLKALACATWTFGDFLGLGLHQMSYTE